MGFFTGLDAEAYDRTYSDRDLVGRIFTYFWPHARQLVIITIALITISVAGAATPILVSRAVDVIAEQGTNQVDQILIIALFILGLIIWMANWVRRRLTSRGVADVMMQLRIDAFAAAASHDLSFYDEHPSGRIVSRITSDTQEFAQIIVLVTDLLNQAVQAAILMIFLVLIEWRLTLLLLFTLPFIFGAALGFRRIARKVTRRGMRVMGNVNAAIKESVTGISVAKNFRQEATIYAEFDEINRQSYRINVRRGLILSLVFPTLNALGGISTAILVYAGGLSAARALLSVGAWYLFISSLNRLWFPVLNLAAFWSQVQSGLSAAERVFALIDTISEVKQSGNHPLEKLGGKIIFDNVNFRYKPHEPILEKFRLTISPGENIAFVGHTGAGKTSIARLISRFYEYQDGKIIIDDRDIRSLDLSIYRRQLGIVSQTPFLFSGTVLENICFARPDVSEENVLELANQIGGGEWLDTLPAGLQSETGERGALLSMGQRQLISLMRVLIQRPGIFILDEATANIDPFTEFQIQDALSLIMVKTTSILIAHRLSTIKAADRIIVLEKGKIIEEGDHKHLIDLGGYYSELYNTYFRHQSFEYIERVHGPKAKKY